MDQSTFQQIKKEILDKAKAGVQEVHLSLTQAAEHLQENRYLGGLGALAGLEERLGYVRTILSLLRDWEQAQTQDKMQF